MKIEKSTEERLGKSISNLFAGIVKRVDTNIKDQEKEKKDRPALKAVKTFASNNNPLKTIPKAISEKKTEVVEGTKQKYNEKKADLRTARNAFRTSAGFAPKPQPRVVGKGYKEAIGPMPKVFSDAIGPKRPKSATPNESSGKKNMKTPPWVSTITKKIDDVQKAINNKTKTDNKKVDKKDDKPVKTETVSREKMLTTIAKSIGGVARNFTEQGKQEKLQAKIKRKEDKKSAKEERALRIKEEKKNLRDSIKQQRKDAKKARFDKGNPLQRISKFQLEAKKARADGTFKTKKWRDRTRKENQMFVYSKITGIVGTLAKILLATLVLGAVLKVIGKTLSTVRKIKEFLFGKKRSEETTDFEQVGLGEEGNIDADKINKSDKFSDKQKEKIQKASDKSKKVLPKLSNATGEVGRDTIGLASNVAGGLLKRAGNLPLIRNIPLVGSALRTQGQSALDAGAATLSATSFNAKRAGMIKDDTVDDLAYENTRNEIIEKGTKEQLKEFEDAYKQANKKNKADEKRLLKIKYGEKLSKGDLKGLDEGEAEMYKNLSPTDANKQLKMFKMKSGRFKGDGSRDLDKITKEVTGKSYTDQKESVLADIMKADPDFLKGQSGDTSTLAAEFKEGSNWSKSQTQRNALLQEIKTAIVSAQQGTTIIDASTKDMSTTSNSAGSGEKEYIGDGARAEDKDALTDFAPASIA